MQMYKGFATYSRLSKVDKRLSHIWWHTSSDCKKMWGASWRFWSIDLASNSLENSTLKRLLSKIRRLLSKIRRLLSRISRLLSRTKTSRRNEFPFLSDWLRDGSCLFSSGSSITQRREWYDSAAGVILVFLGELRKIFLECWKKIRNFADK